MLNGGHPHYYVCWFDGVIVLILLYPEGNQLTFKGRENGRSFMSLLVIVDTCDNVHEGLVYLNTHTQASDTVICLNTR